MACKNTLLVDIGNSSINLKINETYTTISSTNFDKNKIPKHTKSIISCVGNKSFIQYFNNPQIAKTKPYKNLRFDYNLQQLGIDRYLAIIAGFNLYPKTNLMIIDIGTCITIDYIIDNNHQSGGISPGKTLMQNSFAFTGSDSINAWELGINEMIQSYLLNKINNFNGKILITGGGKNSIKFKHKNIIYHQNLVITGIDFYKLEN